MNQFIYRDATKSDLAKIVEIYNSTVSSRMVTADTEPVSVESRLSWFLAHTPQKWPLWVIENNSREVVGWVSLQAFYGRPAYNATSEISIYLDAHQRGKGLGKVILSDCIAKSKRLGIKTLLGFIFLHNEPSIKLFQNLGFTEWGLLPNIALLDGLEKSLCIMGKRI